MIWRELHSTSFPARHVVTHVTILPSSPPPSPPPLLHHHHHHHLSLPERGDFILQEYFRRGIYFYYSFKINSKKSPPGEITSVTVFNEFQNNRPATRQNCNYFAKDGNPCYSKSLAFDSDRDGGLLGICKSGDGHTSVSQQTGTRGLSEKTSCSLVRRRSLVCLAPTIRSKRLWRRSHCTSCGQASSSLSSGTGSRHFEKAFKITYSKCHRLCEFGFCHGTGLCGPKWPSCTNRLLATVGAAVPVAQLVLDQDNPAFSDDSESSGSVAAPCFAIPGGRFATSF